MQNKNVIHLCKTVLQSQVFFFATSFAISLLLSSAIISKAIITAAIIYYFYS